VPIIRPLYPEIRRPARPATDLFRQSGAFAKLNQVCIGREYAALECPAVE
jgi:hypothetical protein